MNAKYQLYKELEEQDIEVCDHCGEAIEQNRAAEVSYCSGCRCVEGPSHYITLTQYEER